MKDTQNKITIYKIEVYLSTKDFKFDIKPIEVTESAKSYNAPGIRIAKDKLVSAQTIWRERYNYVSYEKYCLEGQQQNTLNEVKAYVIERALIIQSECNAMISQIKPEDLARIKSELESQV